eukprot:NODE_2036_length_1297_cov_33.790598_g1937_i0.p1 GENE.NODE_2036_length_1297_cov_33.790598_g1937_i0~~NODE_2036_length_1297_cov_33.790598_g1937_i0.p1  ORF type:complete len:395 (+),score=71.74 NODE_2036_length_1297_cov_33.790598_g1937_i0:41-1225(+)
MGCGSSNPQVSDPSDHEEREYAKEVFRRYDTDQSGTISADEFHKLAEAMGRPLDFKASKRILQSFDVDKNGVLDLDEWLAKWADIKAQLIADESALLPQQIFSELNLVRTDPRTWGTTIAQMAPHFRHKTYQPPGQQVGLITTEGAAAVNEAARLLQQLPALPALELCPALSHAAAAHCADQSYSGATGHTGSDGTTPAQRMARVGTVQGAWAENIAYGCRNAETIVSHLLIDDGLKSRAHRNNILHPAMKKVGVAFGPHSAYGTVCVQCFCAGFQPFGDSHTPIPSAQLRNLPTREEAAAASAIERVARRQNANRLIDELKADKVSGASTVEATGEMTAEMKTAIVDLPDRWQEKITTALQDSRRTVRITYSSGETVVKIWGDGTNSTMRMGH